MTNIESTCKLNGYYIYFHEYGKYGDETIAVWKNDFIICETKYRYCSLFSNKSEEVNVLEKRILKSTKLSDTYSINVNDLETKLKTANENFSKYVHPVSIDICLSDTPYKAFREDIELQSYLDSLRKTEEISNVYDTNDLKLISMINPDLLCSVSECNVEFNDTLHPLVGKSISAVVFDKDLYVNIQIEGEHVFDLSLDEKLKVVSSENVIYDNSNPIFYYMIFSLINSKIKNIGCYLDVGFAINFSNGIHILVNESENEGHILPNYTNLENQEHNKNFEHTLVYWHIE